MIEIWQVRTILKKAWFSDLDIIGIHRKINNEQDSNTISDTPSICKQEQSEQDELPTSENRKNKQLNNTKQTLTRTKNKFRKF